MCKVLAKLDMPTAIGAVVTGCTVVIHRGAKGGLVIFDGLFRHLALGEVSWSAGIGYDARRRELYSLEGDVVVEDMRPGDIHGSIFSVALKHV